MFKCSIRRNFTARNLLCLLVLLALVLIPGCRAQETDENIVYLENGDSPSSTQPNQKTGSAQTGKENMDIVIIEAAGKTFNAYLYDNPSAAALKTQLPMTINMEELNGNEKYCNLVKPLPSDSKSVETINNGDIMLFGDNCLVLFYQSFSTSYAYTPLGYIEDAKGLETALGRGTVEVSFTLQ